VGVCFVLHRFQMRGIVDESVISRISLENNESGGNFTNMLRIILKPATLNTAERAAIADFIVNYPSAEIEQPAEIPAFAEYVEADDADEAPDEVFTPAHATPAVAPTGVTLDTAGLPWDARIHTGSRAMNADGSWRRKRGVDEATIATVEGELKALMSVPVEPASNVLPFTPAPPPPPAEPVAVAVAVPAPPPPPPTDPFIGLIERISSLVGAKAITMEQAQAAIVAAGGVSLPLMVSRPDLIPQVLSAINALVTAA
jgi:hypothetical protein